MTQDDYDFWTKQFDRLSRREKATADKLIEWAEKFGGLAESLKKPPWYQDREIWGRFAIAAAILIVGIFSVINNGCFLIKDYVQLGNCQPIIPVNAVPLNPDNVLQQ